MCNVTGIPNMLDGVDWFFQGEPIVTTASHWIDRTSILKHIEGYRYYSELIIDHSSLQDMGIYLCRGPNLKLDSIRVDVLSAGKPNVIRRGSNTDANYSHASGSLIVSTNYLTYFVTSIVLALLLEAYGGSSCDELSVHMGRFTSKYALKR
ncbi:uncharacterized protein LOC127850068 [Dreissena polymorpha]|nr:uncharacterized protein LOC127850068 [Dreissena polymorpha]